MLEDKDREQLRVAGFGGRPVVAQATPPSEAFRTCASPGPKAATTWDQRCAAQAEQNKVARTFIENLLRRRNASTKEQ